MKGRLKKEQNGITLIALVITIVVLLILSGVVISSMQQSGIIGKSGEAKEEYEQASKNEEEILNSYELAFPGSSSGGGIPSFITSEDRLYENDDIYFSINKSRINLVGDESGYIIEENSCTLSGLTCIPNGTYYMLDMEGYSGCIILLSENVAIFLGEGYESIDSIKAAVSDMDNEEDASFYVLNYTNS